MIKLVAFDFDGTLANTLGLFNKSFEYVFNKMQNTGFPEDFLRHFSACEERVCSYYFPNETERAFSYYLEAYTKNFKEMLPSIDPRFERIFKKIKDNNSHLVILTGRSKETLNISLDLWGIQSYFENKYCGGKGVKNKAQNFRKLFSDFKINSSEVLYIGDSYKDIVSCRSVGVDIISVNYYDTAIYKTLEENNPGKVVRDIADLESKLDFALSSVSD